MGYFKGKKLLTVTENMERGLNEAMSLLDKDGMYINAWSFDDSGNVILFQEMNCGCYKELNKIELGINKKQLDVLSEEEFVLQVEDLLLEVNDSKGYDNLLFNIKDKSEMQFLCEKCR